MPSSIIPRDLVARQLAISSQVLVRYETLGLIRPTLEDSVVGYEPTQVRRIWTILSFQRDLGINLAGVEVILRLHDHMTELHNRLGGLAGELRELCDSEELIPTRSASPYPEAPPPRRPESHE